MSAKRLFKSLIVLGFIAVIVVAIRAAAAEQAEVPGANRAAQQRSLTEYNAAEASAYRWEALASYYKEHDMLSETETEQPQTGLASQALLNEYDAAQTSAYRWEAMANYYKEHGMLTGVDSQLPQTGLASQKLLTEYDAAEVSAYRWEAMADYYKEHNLLTRAEP